MSERLLRMIATSSMINALYYRVDDNVLIVEFSSGSRCKYFDVPWEEFEGLVNAESHGKYFHRHIKDIYDWQPVRKEGKYE